MTEVKENTAGPERKKMNRIPGFRPDYSEENRVVKQEDIEFDGKRYFVSTVDLGLDHCFGDGPPLYWETMIFPISSWRDMYCSRYPSREEAEQAHDQLIADIAAGKYEIRDGYFEKKEESDSAEQ